jgi:riboflavin kinase/FMN adenylyltransferase
MNVFRSIEEIPHQKNSYITLGTFDGIHVGHREILEQLVKKSHHEKSRSVLVTFFPHPKSVVKTREDFIAILTPLEEKIEILQDSGLQNLLVLSFTQELARMVPEEFIKNIFVKGIGVKGLIIGYNHAFGRNREGSEELLNCIGRQFGFTVDVIPPVLVEGKPVSSTRIRQLLMEGEVQQAGKILGNHYQIRGIVQKGRHFGKKLGFPTANLDVLGDHKLIPKDGVYAVFVTFEEVKYKGMANLGFKPTFDSKEHSLEVFIHDFSGDIYNKLLTIEFIHRIRDEKKFDSLDSLKSQIESDRIISLKFLE